MGRKGSGIKMIGREDFLWNGCLGRGSKGALEMEGGVENIGGSIVFVFEKGVGTGPEESTSVGPIEDLLGGGVGNVCFKNIESIVVLENSFRDLFFGDEFRLIVFVSKGEEGGPFVTESLFGIPVFGGAGVEESNSGGTKDAFSGQVVDLGEAIVEKMGGLVGTCRFRPHAFRSGIVGSIVVETDGFAVVTELCVGS